MNEIKISVVMPCFNAEKTILHTLNSILMQTSVVNEIVIVNDGSTDNTVTILEVIKKESDVPIKILSQPNRGVANARNTGIKSVENEWIAFCDSDDIWDSEKISEVRKFIRENDVDFVFHNYRQRKFKYPSKMIKKKDIYLEMLKRCVVQTSTVTVKKNLLLANGGFNTELIVAEDYDLWLKCIWSGNPFFIDKELSQYSLENRGHLSNKAYEMYTCTLKVLLANIENLCKCTSKIYTFFFIEYRLLKLTMANIYFFLRHKELGKSLDCIKKWHGSQKVIMKCIGGEKCCVKNKL